MQDTKMNKKYKLQNTKCKIKNAKCKVQNTKYIPKLWQEEHWAGNEVLLQNKINPDLLLNIEAKSTNKGKPLQTKSAVYQNPYSKKLLQILHNS